MSFPALLRPGTPRGWDYAGQAGIGSASADPPVAGADSAFRLGRDASPHLSGGRAKPPAEPSSFRWGLGLR